MPDEDEEDYLSDKFLVPTPAPVKPTTYSEKRKEALKRSQIRNEQNRVKSRRQRELEAREEGLSKSLFERAAEEEAAGSGSGNKALAMMMKMGFKLGQSLGRVEEPESIPAVSPPGSTHGTPIPEESSTSNADASPPPTGVVKPHRSEPLPLNEWAGRKGIGLGKRAASPPDMERLSKLAKVEGETPESYRERTRRDFEQRRADSRLAPAQRTCVNLDEKAGISFNVLWLNPNKPESFPEGLLDALAEQWTPVPDTMANQTISVKERLRSQMQADALEPFNPELEDEGPPAERFVKEASFSPETLEDAAKFLTLTPQDKLRELLRYLREQYHYCFWCGTEYSSPTELQEQCPGPEEDAHD